MFEGCFALFGGVFFGFVYFGSSLGEGEAVEDKRLVLWSLACWFVFFFHVLREVALSRGACWIEIEVVLRQAGLVI